MTVPVAERAAFTGLDAAAEGFTQARVERIIGLVVALGCAVLGVQSFANAVGSTQESAGWHTVLLMAAFVPLAVMILAAAAGTGARWAARVCAVALLLVFACWPPATVAGGASDTHAWIWYLLNVATSAAVIGFRMPLQVVWAVLAPLLYGVARTTQVWSELTPARLFSIGRDVAFAMIFSGVVIVLAWMLRTAARGIDAARVQAVSAYAGAAHADAVEKERVAVAALMHDSVLAALIAAARASTPREEALAATMAREALTRLANAEQDAGEGSDAPVPAASVVAELARAGRELGVPLPVSSQIDPAAGPVPGRVARAIVLAATQAVANAIQHAGGRGLAAAVRADDRTITVLITDDGAGFDPGAVAEDRLGIRGSIVARMAAAGGRARVHTGASGTAVSLEWDRLR